MKATGPTRNANASAALTARNVPSIAINKPGTAQYLAVGAISVYVVLLALVFATGERAELLPSERLAAGLSGMILSTAFVIRILEQMVRPAPSTGVGTVMIVVHLISCATNLMLTVGPMPMLIDPFTNCRVHLVRWCEWTVLAFTMSFVVEAIDSYDIKRPIAFGLTMGGSTVCGLILPYTTGPISWIIVMTISFVLYFDLFRRVYIKIKNKVAMPAGWPKGGTPQEREAYRRWISARRLVVSCAVMWTAFVADYFGAWIADVTDPCQRDDPSCEHVPMAWPFILDCFVDVAAKMCYAIVLGETHESVPILFQNDFSDWFVAQMSIVWENSSDVLVISTRAEPMGMVSTTASESLHDLIGDAAGRFTQAHRHSLADANDGKSGAEEFFLHMVSTAWKESMKVRPDASGRPSVLIREYRLQRADSTLGCEAHASALPDGSALVMVIRDISDRIARYNAEKALLKESAEKRLIAETVSRQKDEEANRFTRHEVKNGMLAAMSSLTSMHELHQHGVSSGAIVSGDYDTAFDARFVDLNGMLQRTLDTVLAQAMARDVVHGAYKPRPEPTVLHDILVRGEGHAKRFAVRVSPTPFPVLEIDPKLVFHIHRNAVSNACKYGERGGEVRTELEHQDGVLTMRVVNKPGAHHDKLMEVHDHSVVFKKGLRLHDEEDSVSSGDGAWIMSKCAEAIGGSVSIAFTPTETVFTLVCGAPVHVGDEQVLSFLMPRHVRAIGIDDAHVQRAILRSIFSLLSVPPENVRLLGETADEIDNFDSLLIADVRAHPECLFLVLADENLDVDDELRTVSGSQHLARVREQLSTEEDARVLLIVRSANDSDEDHRSYLTRAHGLLPKEPLTREGLLRAIVPQWVRRFGTAATQQSHHHSRGILSLDQMQAALVDDVYDLLGRVCTTDASADWSSVWRTLHALKGNLKSMSKTNKALAEMKRAVRAIESLRCLVEQPTGWPAIWEAIRADIVAAVGPQASEEGVLGAGGGAAR